MSQSGIIGGGSGPVPPVTDPTILPFTVVTHAMSPYTVLSTDCFLASNTSGGGITLYFPNTGTTGKFFYVKDAVGNATNANVVLDGNHTGVNFDGALTRWISFNWECLGFIFNGTNYEVF